MTKRIIRPINPRTGKEYSRSSIYRARHPEVVLKHRMEVNSEEGLEKGIIRRFVNMPNYSETKRLYYQKNKDKINERARLKRKQNPELQNASNYTRCVAKYKKKDKCDICGGIERLQIHHWNYNNPNYVNTLCRDCHEIQHVKNFNRWLKCRLIADKIIYDKLLEVAN
jgi:hypothetical protein